MIIEISTNDYESYFKITNDQLRALVSLTPVKAEEYIRKNCEKATIHCTDEISFGMAPNCEKWEWEEFISEIEEHLDE